MRHRASASAYELIKRFEGFRSRAQRLADGRWIIGYGHTRTARQGAAVSKADADALLLYDLLPVARDLDDLIYTPLTQNQFDALTAFAFNISIEAFRGSTVLRLINAGRLNEAAGAMEMWRKADLGGQEMVVDALVRRRVAEMALFLTPTDGWIPAPTPIVRPRLDHERDPEPLTDNGEAPASRAAAEALSERLSALLPDEAAPASVVEDPLAIEAPAPSESPPAVEAASVEPEAAPAPAPEAKDAEPATLFPSRQVSWRETAGQTRSLRQRDEETAMPMPAVVALFLLGGAMFGGGAYLVLYTSAPGPAWVLATLGAVCLAVSIYAALRRIGGRDD